MSIRVYYKTQGTIPYYYRFTCEKCGCRTHWIKREWTEVTPGRSAAMVENAIKEKIDELKNDLESCLAGKRMLVEPKPNGIIQLLNGKCLKCKHEQSWTPQIAPGLFKKKQQKNADEYNSQPVLSQPDVIFGGDFPESEERDFTNPCKFVIKGSSFGMTDHSPIFLNSILVGFTDKSSIDLSVETFYRDNIIMVQNAVWTFYIEGEEGKTIPLEYSNFCIKRK